MSESSQGPGWWQASDGMWYPPHTAPASPPPPSMPPPSMAPPFGTPYAHPSPYVPAPTNGLATAGFVCGLIGLFICLIPLGIFVGGPVAIVGVVLGFLGRGRSREANGAGAGMATAGIILSFAGIAIGVLWLVVFGALIKTVNDNVHIGPNDFTVTQQRCARSQLGGIEATGDITNTTGDRKLLVNVQVKVLDANGRVVGSVEDFAGDVGPHETRAYSARGPLDDASVERFTCSVTVG